MHARYEQHFEPMDAREVTVHQTTHRVVNYVERAGGPNHSADNYEQGYENDQWFSDETIYPGGEGPRNNDYPRDQFYDEPADYGNYPRNSHQQDPHYQQQQQFDRDDLRHQIRTRKNGRPGPYPSNRGRGFFQNREENNKFRPLQNAKGEWERPSAKRKNVPPAKKNPPAESDKDPQSKPVEDSTPSPNVPIEEPPKTSILAKETPSDSGVGEAEGETAPPTATEVQATSAPAPPASGEPKRIQEEDFKARRADAIQAKALEIEKDYQQDCETFVTVVKMLVSKEPKLENLLQGALNANLSEMKHKCLTSFKQYVKELNKDHVMYSKYHVPRLYTYTGIAAPQ
ncbi:uncharacterized protein LOC144192084 isoform X2 [Stigmatopora nigra]